MIHYPMDTVSGMLTGGQWAVNRLASDPLVRSVQRSQRTKQPSLSTTSKDMISLIMISPHPVLYHDVLHEIKPHSC